MTEPALSVRGLCTELSTNGGWVPVVRDVGFDVRAGETLALVGESGSGKTLTAKSLIRLLPRRLRVASGEVRVGGVDLLGLPEARLRHHRGKDIAVVFQDPGAYFDPVATVGFQIAEAIGAHDPVRKGRAALADAVRLLTEVGIPDAERRSRQYPHQFSGGMLQRAMIAMALAAQPRVVIADEPTTALDVTLQVKIVELLRRLRAERDSSMLLITHDLGLVAELADRVAVMYAGRIVELADTVTLFRDPRHPYTKDLLDSRPHLAREARRLLRAIPGEPPLPTRMPFGCAYRPRCSRTAGRDRCAGEGPPLVALAPGHEAACHFWDEAGGAPPADAALLPARAAPRRTVLTVTDATKTFPVYGGILRREVGRVRAVNGVSFDLTAGETLGLVGESGCGKSTMGRLLIKMLRPDSGTVHVTAGSDADDFRKRVQWVHQDPYGSLNPRLTVAQLLTEPLHTHRLHRGAERARVAELLDLVGLNGEHRTRYPHQLSGGQRQRVAIARALAVEPDIVVLDEPVSALDVSVQAQIINLLMELQRRTGVAYVLISHDLNVVRHICDRVAVMYLGRIVEIGSRDEIYGAPRHPYTKALLSSVFAGDPSQREMRRPILLRNEVGSPLALPTGCLFHPRCWKAGPSCMDVEPTLAGAGGATGGHAWRCHYPIGGDDGVPESGGTGPALVTTNGEESR